MKSTQRERIVELDVIRFAAIVLVLICHSSEQAFSMSGGSAPMAVLHTLGRLGVPLFLFLTGALILKKDFSSSRSIILFYRKNLVSLLLTVEIWIVIYGCYLFFCGQEFTFYDYIKCALFINDIPMMHWWYIPAIIMIYVALPFASRAVRNLDIKGLALPFMLIVVLGFLLPTINSFLSIWGKGFQNVPDLAPLGGFLFFYIVLGMYLIDERTMKLVSNFQLTLLAFLGVFGACLQEYLGLGLWYNNFFIILTAVTITEFIFRLLSVPRIKSRVHEMKRELEVLSKTAFFVYFVHVPVLTFVERLASCLNLSLAHFSVSFIGTLILSYLIAITGYKLLDKMPRLRKAIFNS